MPVTREQAEQAMRQLTAQLNRMGPALAADLGVDSVSFEFGGTITLPDTMTVRVRDRSAESPWGDGPNRPVVRTVTISATCPQCGARRGQPRNLNQVDDGEHYSTDVWDNPCGHTDHYEAVVAEAARLCGGPDA